MWNVASAAGLATLLESFSLTLKQLLKHLQVTGALSPKVNSANGTRWRDLSTIASET